MWNVDAYIVKYIFRGGFHCWWNNTRQLYSFNREHHLIINNKKNGLIDFLNLAALGLIKCSISAPALCKAHDVLHIIIPQK